MDNRRESAPQNRPANPGGPVRQASGSGRADNLREVSPPSVQPDSPANPGPASQPSKRVDRPLVEPQDSCRTCPECGGPLSHESACVICYACGYSQCG